MPTLSMVRSALVETRRRTQRFSLSTQKRCDCKLGKKRRLVLLFACETLLPTIGPFPVTWHTRAIILPLEYFLLHIRYKAAWIRVAFCGCAVNLAIKRVRNKT